MTRLAILAMLLPFATAARTAPPAGAPMREVWVADDAAGSAERTVTLALRDALAVVPAPAARRHRRVRTPPVVPSAPASRIVYLADDVRLDRRRGHFRYTALLTDRSFRTTTSISGRCRVDQVAACARAIVARLPA